MANTGLNVSDVANVTILMSPIAAQIRNFGNLLILGDSDVIDTVERTRAYTDPDDIATDFGGDAPEYQAAVLYFGQSPKPQQCYIGRWASTSTHGLLRGGVVAPTIQSLNAITNGSMTIHVDGTNHVLSNLNFSAAANMNGVASVIQTALSGVATVAWLPAGYFIIESTTTGTLSTVGLAAPSGSGTDVSVTLGLTQVAGAYSADGLSAEDLTYVVALLADASTDWYGLQLASNAVPEDDDIIAVSKFIEAATVSRIFGVTIQDPSTIDSATSTDLASKLRAGGFRRTFTQYSSDTAYATASIFGRAFTVDFEGVNTSITIDFKQEPGVSPEALTESQAKVLKTKNCNVFTKYNNNTAILQNGCMCSGDWFDAIHGTDWLQNEIQTDLYNLYYTTTTKIPQTDGGVNLEIATVSAACQRGVTNGLIAPGVWTGPPLGVIQTGQTLVKGFYVFAQPVGDQNASDRAARKSPPIQAAVKLAGAIQSGNVVVSVNQ